METLSKQLDEQNNMRPLLDSLKLTLDIMSNRMNVSSAKHSEEIEAVQHSSQTNQGELVEYFEEFKNMFTPQADKYPSSHVAIRTDYPSMLFQLPVRKANAKNFQGLSQAGKRGRRSSQ